MLFRSEAKSSYSIRVRSTDSGSPVQYFEKAFTISVTDVNETPTNITLSNSTVEENVGPNAAIGTFSTTDPDAGQTFTYTLVSGTDDTDNDAFTLTSAGALTLKAAANYEAKSSYSIRVRSTDSGSPVQYFEKSFTISVTDVKIGRAHV